MAIKQYFTIATLQSVIFYSLLDYVRVSDNGAFHLPLATI